MNQRQPSEEQLTNQPISQEPHSEEQFPDRGTADTIGGEGANTVIPDDQHTTGEETNLERRARERASGDEAGGKRAAKVGGTAAGMFFPAVILAIIAVALILFFVFM